MPLQLVGKTYTEAGLHYPRSILLGVIPPSGPCKLGTLWQGQATEEGSLVILLANEDEDSTKASNTAYTHPVCLDVVGQLASCDSSRQFDEQGGPHAGRCTFMQAVHHPGGPSTNEGYPRFVCREV